MSFLLNNFKSCLSLIKHHTSISTGNCLQIIFQDLAKKSFLFHLEYGRNAEVRYRYHKDYFGIIDLHHTYVPKQYRGLGVASAMAEEVFEYLIEHNIKVTLSCPFLIDYYKNHPEIKKIIFEPTKPSYSK